MDLLADKISRSPLKLYLPDYEGPNTYEAAVSYFRRTFVKCNREAKTLYTHVTCATDTRQIKCESLVAIASCVWNVNTELNWCAVVLKAMLDILIKESLRNIGFL